MVAATRIELTDARVRQYAARRPAKPTDGSKVQPYIYRDAKTRGLFLEVNTASASYRVATSTHDRKQLKVTLGRISEMDVHEARKRAEEILARARKGEAKVAITTPPTPELTLGEAYERYCAGRERQAMDPVHTSNIRLNARTHLSDWLGLPVSAITQPAVVERHTRIGKERGVYAANHTMKQLRAVINALDGVDNPVRKIVWFKPKVELDEHGQPVAKALKAEELPAWWQAVSQLPSPLRRALHQLALLSGMRYGHLTETRRAWVDLPGRCIRYPKLKRGKPFALPLSGPMLSIVEGLMPITDRWLFPGDSAAGHITDWREDGIITGHALRHTYVSIAYATKLTDHHRRALVDHAAGKDIHASIYTDLGHAFKELLEAQEEVTARILALCQPSS